MYNIRYRVYKYKQKNNKLWAVNLKIWMLNCNIGLYFCAKLSLINFLNQIYYSNKNYWIRSNPCIWASTFSLFIMLSVNTIFYLVTIAQCSFGGLGMILSNLKQIALILHLDVLYLNLKSYLTNFNNQERYIRTP